MLALLPLLLLAGAPATNAKTLKTETLTCPDGLSARERKSGVFTERWCEKYDGTREGPYLSFHASGTLRERGTMHAGKRRGPYSRWDDKSGKKIEEGEYRDDWKTGWWTTWYATGVKKSEGEYADDKPRGWWTYYDAEGRKKEEGEFRAGAKHGIWVTYDAAGTVTDRRDFRDGKER